GSSDIGRGKVGEQRIFARAAVAVTRIALRLAAEQVVTRLLLRRELRLLREDGVELRGQGGHLGRGLIAGDRLPHLIECRRAPPAIQFSEMDRQRVGGGGGSWLVADLLDVARPRERERLRAPD